jgi:hypothetical protein
MMIVYASNAEQYTVRKSEYLRIKNLTFGSKIKRLKKIFENFHPDLLLNNATLFEKLDTFNEFRNKMAHCPFEWNYSTVKFDVIEVIEDENGFQYYEPIPFTVTDARLATLEGTYLAAPLLEILNEVSLRLKNQHPELYASLRLGEDSHPPK